MTMSQRDRKDRNETGKEQNEAIYSNSGEHHNSL